MAERLAGDNVVDYRECESAHAPAKLVGKAWTQRRGRYRFRSRKRPATQRCAGLGAHVQGLHGQGHCQRDKGSLGARHWQIPTLVAWRPRLPRRGGIAATFGPAFSFPILPVSVMSVVSISY